MSRKGVTPVLATSLLILIAVAAVSSTAVFLRNTTDDITEGAQDQLSQNERIKGTSISIERAYNNSDGNTTISVRNTGKYLINIEDPDLQPASNKTWELYNNGRPVGFEYISAAPDTALDSGEAIRLKTPVKYPSANDDYERIEIQGRYGIESGIICDNPGGTSTC